MSRYSRHNPEEPIRHDWLAGARTSKAQGSFAAPARSAATCEWHMSAEHKCGEPAEWEMLDEEWSEQVPVCSAHADHARSDGLQVRKRQNIRS